MEIVIDSFAASMASNETMSSKDSVKYIAELLEHIEQADRFILINRIRKERVWGHLRAEINLMCKLHHL